MRPIQLITVFGFMLSLSAAAQPTDTLFVNSADSTYAYAIDYAPEQDTTSYTRIATYRFDPDRIAVELGYKRGKPCGVYKSYYPDGRLMEFAVYGWGHLHGNWVEYDEFGKIVVKGFYKNGKRSGLWNFKYQGILGNYKNGMKHGRWRYYEGGRLVKTERYRNDEKVVKGKLVPKNEKKKKQ